MQQSSADVVLLPARSTRAIGIRQTIADRAARELQQMMRHQAQGHTCRKGPHKRRQWDLYGSATVCIAEEQAGSRPGGEAMGYLEHLWGRSARNTNRGLIELSAIYGVHMACHIPTS